MARRERRRFRESVIRTARDSGMPFADAIEGASLGSDGRVRLSLVFEQGQGPSVIDLADRLEIWERERRAA